MGTPWANSAGAGFIRSVPVPSQIGVTDGAASFTDGFVSLNFQPIESGGVPPFGQDFNGILKEVTKWLRWDQAGNTNQYNSAFSTAIGGYPKGAVLQSTALGTFWLNAVDDNTNDPDATPTNWMKCFPGNYYGLDQGTTNNYSCVFAPPLTAHQPGLLIRCKIAHTNTGACNFDPTNTSTPKAIKTPWGLDPLVNQLPAGMVATFVYDGTFYQILNPVLDGTYFRVSSALAEGNPTSMRANLQLGPTDIPQFGGLTLLANLFKTSEAGMQTIFGVSAAAAENTMTTLYNVPAGGGVWLVYARRTDVGDHGSIALYYSTNSASSGVVFAAQWNDTTDLNNVTFQTAPILGQIQAKRNVGAGIGTISWVATRLLSTIGI